VVASFAPYLSALAVPAAVSFARAGRAGAAAFSAAAAAGGLLGRFPVRSASRSSADLVVMSANLWHGRADVGALLELAARHSVDVLLVQELTHEASSRLTRLGAEQVFPHAVSEPRIGGAGTALFSRHPLSDARSHDGLAFAAVSALVHVPGREPVRVASVHPSPPWPLPLPQHRADYQRLHELLATFAASARVVVGGDFNATIDHRQFRLLLRDGYSDAARQAGVTWLATYPAGRGRLPLIEIDHILTRRVVAVTVRGLRVPGTDHRAVIAGLHCG
jgi:endonuclease/exonuclease/phosphatase (EEP) superfamily protein YafD